MANEMDDGEIVLQNFSDIECLLDAEALGSGALTLTNRKIVWQPSSNNNSGSQSWSWREVVMHAEASDAAVHARPCLYAHLVVGSDEDALKELRLVPKESDIVHVLFNAFNQGAELNPDPVNAGDEDEGDWIFNPEEVYGGAAGDAMSRFGQDGNGEDNNGNDNDNDNGDEDEEEEYEDDEAMGDAEGEGQGEGAFEDAS